MIVNTNPEFGIELALTVPYAYWLHKNNELDVVITSKGMTPYYFFAENVIEEHQSRTIDNAAAGLNSLPNNWIHGINSIKEPGVLDYSKWEVPPYGAFYSNNEYTFIRPTVFLTNKYNFEHGHRPYGFFDIESLYKMFSILNERGYDVIYKRPSNTEKEFAFDQNEITSINSQYRDIQANVEGIGLINDYQLTEFFDNVKLIDSYVLQSNDDYNTTQLKLMANCSGFISVGGGNCILSSLFKKPTISYLHTGKELRQNYFGENSYFQKLSDNNVYPAYDVIGEINNKTYERKVNNSGKNDYSAVYELIDKLF